MRYDTRFRGSSSTFYLSFPRGVKWLIVANVAVFLLEWFVGLPIGRPLALIPWDVIHRGEIWQLVTYMFLHAGIFHILFNMLMLWMFGSPIEDTWGTRRFLQYYFVCGVGAALSVIAVNFAVGDPLRPLIGASGAIFGLLLAYGVLFPDQSVLMMFLFPIKAKYMVMIYGVIELLLVFRIESPVSSLAHLGGMLFGYAFIKWQFAPRRRRPAYASSRGFSFDLERRWKEYKLQRARKKFQVYLKKHGSNRNPWEQ
jgi:membrane associated rhomboid family serine protease